MEPPNFSEWYFFLCLSELPWELARPELDRYRDFMTGWLTNRSCVMHSEDDKTYHPVLLSILRNALSRYPDYAYIKDRLPLLCDRDGRLHFDMTPQGGSL